MKKSRLLAIVLAIMLCVLSVFTAGCSRQKLDVPSDFDIDDDIVLRWDSVENARSYTVEIKTVATGKTEEKNPRRSNYSLADLEEGDYEFRVKAIGDGKKFSSSGWSETIAFHRDHETGCIYNLIANNTEYEVYRVGNASGELVIEDYYRGKPVTSIGVSAFAGLRSEITHLTVGNRVRSIGASAFANCATLETVSLSESVTFIDTAAFLRCTSLESVNIPDGVNTIPDDCFAYCSSLKSINLNNVTTIGKGAFRSCSSLTELTIPDGVEVIGMSVFEECKSLATVKIGSGISRLPQDAFQRCSALENVEFSPESKLNELGTASFAYCTNLKSITLPSTLTMLNDRVFIGSSSLEEINGVENLTAVGRDILWGTKFLKSDSPAVYLGDWLVGFYQTDKIKLMTINEDNFKVVVLDEDGNEIKTATLPVKSGLRGISNYAFSGSSELLSVTLAPSVKYLGNSAFSKCEKLWRLIIKPNGLLEIGNYAFSSCTELNSIDFGNKLQKIGGHAFYGCSALDNQKIDGEINKAFIPNTVTEIGYCAFDETKMKDPNNYDGSVFYAGNWAIGARPDVIDSGDPENPVLRYPTAVSLQKGTRGIAGAAFLSNTNLANVTGANDVEYIGDFAFYNCQSLASITLNANIQKIGKYTFYYCKNLFSISLPRSLESIEDYAFSMCESLTEVDFMRSPDLTSIGNYAFYGCINLQAVNLRDNLEEIGYCAFTNCSSIKTVTIPQGVKTVRYGTFANCNNLETVNFSQGLTSIEAAAFLHCTSLKEVKLPDTVKTVGDYAFYYSAHIMSLDLGKVETIGERAFGKIRNITSVVIPSSVTSIGKYAFRDCKNLRSVIIRDNEASFDAHIFSGCSYLTVFAESDKAADSWIGTWNSSFNPVVWGVTVSEDGNYVRSITVGEATFENIYTITDKDGKQLISNRGNPAREGYKFVGWATSPEATTAEYIQDDIQSLPSGTVLYSVWEEVEEDYVREILDYLKDLLGNKPPQTETENPE